MPREPQMLLLAGAVAFIAFGIAPVLGIAPCADRFTWLLENLPTLIAVPILVASFHRFPLTLLVYRLLLAHALVLMIGGHWTYAKVPVGDWVRDALHLTRNPYDRFGHLVQGFVPVMVMRELLLRHGVLVSRGKLMTAALLLMALGISAAYELVEWITAVTAGSAATDFLGTQGDPWDTQWDMACALIGAGSALATLSRLHDRQLAALAPAQGLPAGGAA